MNDRFLVHLSLFSRDISEAASDYVGTSESMQDFALAAITRAQNALQP